MRKKERTKESWSVTPAVDDTNATVWASSFNHFFPIFFTFPFSSTAQVSRWLGFLSPQCNLVLLLLSQWPCPTQLWSTMPQKKCSPARQPGLTEDTGSSRHPKCSFLEVPQQHFWVKTSNLPLFVFWQKVSTLCGRGPLFTKKVLSQWNTNTASKTVSTENFQPALLITLVTYLICIQHSVHLHQQGSWLSLIKIL